MVMEEQVVRDSIPDALDSAGNWMLKQKDSVRGPEYSITKPFPLHQGTPIPPNPFHQDWLTGILLMSAVLYIIVISFSKNFFSDIIRVLSFSARWREVADSQGIFHWQTTLANLASFIILSTFLYMLSIEKGVVLPEIIQGPVFWILLLMAISLSVTLRHFVTVAAGNISGKRTLFAEYLNNIYSFYRLIGIVLIPLVVAISYLPFSVPSTLINTGLGIVGFVFIFRIISLLIIFIRGGVPIFYFLLYLCALEILPGSILIKLMTA